MTLISRQMENQSIKFNSQKIKARPVDSCPTRLQGPYLLIQLQDLCNEWKSLKSEEHADNSQSIAQHTKQVHNLLRLFLSSTNCQYCSSFWQQYLLQSIQDCIESQEEYLILVLAEFFPLEALVFTFTSQLQPSIPGIIKIVNRLICCCKAQSSFIDLDDGLGLIIGTEESQKQHEEIVSSQFSKLQQCPQSQCPTQLQTRIIWQQLSQLLNYCKSAPQATQKIPEDTLTQIFITPYQETLHKWNQYQDKPKCVNCNTQKCLKQRTQTSQIMSFAVKKLTQIDKNCPIYMVANLNKLVHQLKRLSTWCEKGGHFITPNKLEQGSILK